MPVIARDAVASDHLVYAWPFPIGPEEYEVSCAEDELVVMCPSWLVGDRLGPGRHRWRSPDPMRPASAFFVLTAPVEVSFDVATQFVIPNSGQPVRLRASGSLQVQCTDPALLIAQFVGLPFDHVNEGILRSVSRSVERMLARLLTRRVIMGGTPAAVTDPAMMPHIIDELVAYNPAAGAVFGVQLVRMGHLSIQADDGSQPWVATAPTGNGQHRKTAPLMSRPDISLPEMVAVPRTPTPLPVEPPSTRPPSETSGEIVVRRKSTTLPPPPPVAQAIPTTPLPASRPAGTIEVPHSSDDVTQPGVQIMRTPVPGSVRAESPPVEDEPRGSILGIGMSHIGSAAIASGEIPTKVAPGARVLVPGPNGLMQSATVRQLLQGYYELEVGGSGETIWVPINGVVPE